MVMVSRRGFLKGILAAGVAPYVCTTAGVLMPVRSIALPNDHITATEVSTRLEEALAAIRRGLEVEQQKMFNSLMLCGTAVMADGVTLSPSEYTLRNGVATLNNPARGVVNITAEWGRR